MIIDAKVENMLVMTLIVMTDMLDEAKEKGCVFNDDILATANQLCIDLNDTITEVNDNK